MGHVIKYVKEIIVKHPKIIIVSPKVESLSGASQAPFHEADFLCLAATPVSAVQRLKLDGGVSAALSS